MLNKKVSYNHAFHFIYILTQSMHCKRHMVNLWPTIRPSVQHLFMQVDCRTRFLIKNMFNLNSWHGKTVSDQYFGPGYVLFGYVSLHWSNVYVKVCIFKIMYALKHDMSAYLKAFCCKNQTKLFCCARTKNKNRFKIKEV